MRQVEHWVNEVQGCGHCSILPRNTRPHTPPAHSSGWWLGDIHWNNTIKINIYTNVNNFFFLFFSSLIDCVSIYRNLSSTLNIFSSASTWLSCRLQRHSELPPSAPPGELRQLRHSVSCAHRAGHRTVAVRHEGSDSARAAHSHTSARMQSEDLFNT